MLIYNLNRMVIDPKLLRELKEKFSINKEVIPMRFKCRILSFCMVMFLMLTACTHQVSIPPVSINRVQSGMSELKKVTLDRSKIVVGQTVYVPIYSYIYHQNNQDNAMNLSATLSLRNTDLEHPLIIKVARYYDKNGKMVRDYLESPVQINALGSTHIFINASDLTGGLGANFIIEWVAESVISEPVIEAIMISTSLNQGISFVSTGKVIKEYKKSP